MKSRAKEILESQTNNGYELLEDEDVNVYEVLIAMRIYAKEKCREQRSKCTSSLPRKWESETISGDDLENIADLVFNANEPDFE